MADFRTYQEREEKRRSFFLTAAAATAVAVAIPGVRKGIARLAVKGIARAGRFVGSMDPPTRFASSAAELKALLTRGIPEAARFGLGRQGAVQILRDELAQFGSTGLANQAIHASEQQAERILATQAYRRFALQKAETRGLLFDDDIGEILEARIRAVQQIDPSLALDQIQLRERQRLMIAFERSRTAFPGRGAAMQEQFVQDALQFARQMATEEFKRQAGGGRFASRVARFFGIGGVQVADPRLAARLGDARQQLIDLGIDPILAGSLPAHGFVQVGGDLVDLTRIRQGVTRVTDWLSQHFQIPLGPGMMGITPTQLFPWLRGQVQRDFALIAANAKDPALRAMLHSTGQSVGKDVIQVGRRFLVADFEEGALSSLVAEGELRSGLYGFAKRRAEQIVAAEEARAAGRRGPWSWLGLGQGYGESFIGKARSVFTKFSPESTWAPRLFQRILTGEIDQISPREVRQLGRFLTNQELPEAVQQALISRAGNLGLEPELLTALGVIGEDQSVLDWFQAAIKADPAGKTPFMHSQKMRELVNHFRTSPRSALARFDPASDRNDLLDWNFLGRDPGRTAVQQMRNAIFDELESRVQLTGSTADAGFLELIDNLGSLSTKDRQASLAYGQGKLILRRLEERDSIAALDWLRQNQPGQGQIQEYIRRTSRFWQTYDVPEGEGLRTGELFIRQKYGFLEQYNRALKSGATWPGAMWDAVRGPWGRQYAAFFTGHQQDVTAATLGLEYFSRKLNEMLQDFLGLGLPAQDLRSGGSILGNLFLKRILPSAAGYELYRYADYKGDELGTGGPSDLYANLRSRAGLFRARHFGESILGMRRELFPGLEKILPERTEEEEAEFQRTGKEPVRKGRFWFLGSREEFWGGKIDYYLPSAVQVARSDWQAAENVDLNTRAYWENAFLPLPENNFLGPLNPTRRSDWWEQRHSVGPAADRPYLITGELFDPNTLHGPLLNATIGRVLKPRRVLHPEYLPQDLGGAASREELRRINEAMKQGLDIRGIGLIVGGGAGGGGGSGGGSRQPGGTGGGEDLVSPGVIGGAGTALGSLGVITPGGQVSLISLPMGLDRRDLSQMGRSTYQPRGHGARLSRREIERINRLTEAGAGGLAGLRPADVLRLSTQTTPFSEEDLDLINFQSGLIAGTRTLTDVAGLYGWMAETGLSAAGVPLEQKGLTVASPSRAYGYGRRFYDLALGGLGGPLSEVGRRFLTRRGRQEDFNPLPNLMPAWLPGPEYFIDFRHGDPYCVSQDTLIETGLLQFLPAGNMSAEMTITSHRGRHLPVRGLAVRPVRSGEKVYSLKLCSLTGVRMQFSEEHPILVVDNPEQRRNYRAKVRVQKYRHANVVLRLLCEGRHQRDIALQIGLTQGQVSTLCGLLEADGKIQRGKKKSVPTVLDPKPYDIQLLENGLRWVPIKDLQPGRYVAYPRPKVQELAGLVLDLGELTGYPCTERYVYSSGTCRRADFAEAYEWLQEHGTPHFSWGERKAFLQVHNWTARAYEAAQEVIRLGRVPERVARSIEVTEDLAYAFGLYLAEGWVADGLIGFALHADEELLFERACQGLQQLDPEARASFERKPGTNDAYAYFRSELVARLIGSLFGKGAHNKHIPDMFATITDVLLAAFLAGLFDGDGHCFEVGDSGGRLGTEGRLRIGLTSCNLVLLLQVRKLLLRWGIVGSIIEKAATPEKKIRSGTNWVLQTRGGAAVALGERLGYPVADDPGCKSARWTFVTDDYVFLRVLSVEAVEGIMEVYGFDVDEDDSFCVAGAATHNTKIPRGELRLPGNSYEQVHSDVRLMQTRASSLGKSIPEMMQSMLHVDEPMSEFGEQVTEFGTDVHRLIQRRWKRMGVLIGAEQTITNEELGISGHFDAMLRTREGVRIVEIKTVGAKQFAEAQRHPFAEHVSQLNFYLHETGIRQGMLVYVNQDNPAQQFTHHLGFDPGEFQRSISRVQEARRQLGRLVDQGVISRGDLYCVSPETLIEVNGNQLVRAADVRPGDRIRTHRGIIRPVERVRWRTVELQKREKVYRFTVATLPAFPFTVSQDHPLLVSNRPKMRKQGRLPRELRRLQLANQILEVAEARPCQIKDLIAATGSDPEAVRNALRHLTEDGKVQRCSRYGPIEVVDPSPYDLEMTQRGLIWKTAEATQVGDYVAYPLPDPIEREIEIDLADLPTSEKWQILDDEIYYGKGSAQYAEITRYLRTHGTSTFGWGERKPFLEARGWDSRTYNHADQDLKNYGASYWFPRRLKISPALATLMGYYVAEGDVSEDGRISWSLHRDELDFVAEIDQVLQTLCGRTGATQDRTENGVAHRITCQPLARLLVHLFGTGAKAKHLPEWWIELPNPVLIAFLRGLFNGDGCAFQVGNRSHVSMVTSSRDLAYQVRLLLLKLGVVASIVRGGQNESTLVSGKVIRSGVVYQVNVNSASARKLAALFGYEYIISREDENTTSSFTWYLDDRYLYLRVNRKEETDPGEVPEVIGFQVGEDNSFCVAGVATHNTAIDRFEILADVAPYSQQYATLRQYLVAQNKAGQLDERENTRFQLAKKRVAAQKKRVQTTPYRFRNLNLEKRTFTVKRILDPNTIQVHESENPIRLAGVRSSQDRIEEQWGPAPVGISLAEWQFAQFGIGPGAKLSVGLEGDPLRRVAEDTLQTMHAVVYNGGNLNRRLIELGVGTEKETDYSDTGVAARFTGWEQFLGRAWESVAHADTPINCLAPWTEVITCQGLTRADKIVSGDRVLTAEGRYRLVVDAQPQPAGKRVVGIKLCGSKIKLTVTEDHPILAVRAVRKRRITSRATGKKLDPWGTDPKPEFILAGGLEPYDFVAYRPEEMSAQGEAEPIDLAQLGGGRFAFNATEVWCNGGQGARMAVRERHFPVTTELTRLLGYYASEGCTSASANGKPSHTIFSFSVDETDYVEDVCQLIRSLGGPDPGLVQDGGTLHVKVGWCYLAEIVSHYVGHKTKKRAPKELLTNHALRAEFVRGLLRGDGTKAGYSRYNFIGMAAVEVLVWLRDALANLWQIPAILTLAIDRSNPCYGLHIGKWPLLSDFVDGEDVYAPRQAQRDGAALCNRIVVDGWILYRIQSVQTSDYQGSTIDIEVEDDDTFATLNASVHNTKFLRVRSPLEELERSIVFGKSTGSWQHPFCLTPDTGVHTRGGITPIGEVKVGDQVLTHDGYWREVRGVSSRETSETVLAIKAHRSHEVTRITPNHQVPVVRGVRPAGAVVNAEEIEWIPAGDLTTNDYLLVPVPQRTQEAIDLWELIECRDRLEADETTIYQCIRHHTGKTIRGAERCGRTLTRHTTASSDLWKLLGYYVAEGNTTPRTGHIKFSFNAQEEEYHAEVQNLLRSYGLNPVLTCTSSGGVSIHGYSVLLSRVVKALCPGTSAGGDKRLHPALLSLPDEALTEILRSLFKGDGNSSGYQDRWRVSTASRTLAHQIRLILGRLGYPASIYCNEGRKQVCFEVYVDGAAAVELLALCVDGQKCRKDTRKNDRPKRQVVFVGDVAVGYRVQRIEAQQYTGEVYDLSVEDRHTYTTAGFAVHNSDYISPTLTSFAAQSPLWGAAGLGIFSTFFFKTQSMKKRALFAGLAAGAALPVLRAGYETLTGKTWKPLRTQKREALEEYWDILKYVKYRGLAAQEEKLARQKEGVNIERMARDLHRQGERRKARRNTLEAQKRELILAGREKNRQRISEIQDELDQLAQPAGMMKLGPHTTRALQFRELYRSALHGIDPGNTPFLNLFRAFPKYKRELIQGFIEKSDEKERLRIFQLLPRAEQRVLGRYLGIPQGRIPDRPLLRDYFRSHPLPGPDWIGWSLKVDLEDLRMQAIRHENLDPFESGIYPVQIDEAESRTENVPIPTVQGHSQDIQNRLNAILSGKGLKNVRVQVDIEPHNGDGDHLQIQMDLKQRREQDIRRALQLS